MTAYPSLEEFAVALRDEDVPDKGRKLAVDAITDCVACMLAGNGSELAAPLRAVIGAPDHASGTALIGTRARTAVHDAALYHGALAHALDYDDISHPAYSHPSTVLVPALLAAATVAQASGRDFVTAYIVGLEVFGRLGRALNLQHYKNGWHSTSTFGSIASAVAVSRLLKLPASAIRMAVGIAASASSGLRANFGTMTKPLHAGYAARNGVLAARLAQQGFTASTEALSHRYGFTRVFNATGGIGAAALETWGAELEILTEFGIALKLYPACAATHPAIEAATKLHTMLGNPAKDIAAVRVGACELATEPLIYREARTPLEGKFSMHYCVASALVDGAVRLSTFTSEAVRREVVQDLVQRTEMVVDERVRDDKEFAAIVEVITVDGRRLEETVHVAPGKPARWFTAREMQEKFMDCHAASGLTNDPHAIFAALQGIDRTQTVASLLQQLAD
jgi:2-methylcitrate dehydratase PrpD